MPAFADPDFAPFGWSVGCSGHKPVQVREEVLALVERAIAQCETYFPRERGYRVAACSPAGPGNGVQLTVHRGDFRASMAVESTLDPKRRAAGQWAVRVYGRAESAALAEAERAGHRVVQRARSVGVAGGFALFLAFCWLAVGVNDPVFWLGGLLMVVAGLMTTTLGGAFGVWVGERIADKYKERALASVQSDPGLDMDLKRWRALTRQVSGQRQALKGRIGSAPFRALMPATDEPSRPLRIPRRLAPTG